MCREISLATCGGVLITATWTRTECAGSPKTTVLPSFFLPIFLLQATIHTRFAIMTIDEFEPEDVLTEINRKLANVSITNLNYSSGDVVDKSILPNVKQYLEASQPREKECFTAVQMIRKYLTQGTGTASLMSTNDILQLDILPRLRELLVEDNVPDLQFEVAWIVTNIAAGTSAQVHPLIEAGFVPALLECLKAPRVSISVKAQAAWALSNFAGESAALREELMRKGAITAVAHVLSLVCDETYDESIIWSGSTKRVTILNEDLRTDIKALTWSISNMARGGFRTADFWDMYIPAFEALSKAILFDHRELWVDGGWGLSRILHNTHDVEAFYHDLNVDPNLGTRLAELLVEPHITVSIPILRTLINITSAPTDQSMMFFDSQLLSVLSNLMSQDTPTCLRRDAFLVVANLVATESPIVEQVLEEDQILREVESAIGVPSHVFDPSTATWAPQRYYVRYPVDEDWKVTMEALWIVCNLLTVGCDAHITALLESYRQLPTDLMSILYYDHDRIPLNTITKTIDAMIDLVKRTNNLFNEDINPITQHWIECDIGNQLASLQQTHSGRQAFVESCLELNDLVYQCSNNVAAMFGLANRLTTTGANKRRVLHGLEDGDVRLIENAVGKLTI
ncbi:importin subunit alpha-1-like [Lichtheimia corymbifera JMRC:FSU:9682]|uniref:Importin subunit alpha-1-like n=1 Tax=Lichtheimia corymbifera JMRC:FSU:9682 TaxID=1263082 RepID=A0A068RI93_9FUNG|nr:importin subunit alpha-1-like [Lichtheimia corymbifera JMRC:FSU:9682]